MAKTRVAPVKTITIPRIELATIGPRLYESVWCSLLTGELSTQELAVAENFMCTLVQQTLFSEPEDEKITSSIPFGAEEGLLRIRSRISNRIDTMDFRYPIILPSKHPLVQRMIFRKHQSLCHAGVTGVLSAVRERFWVVGGRRSVREVIGTCEQCKRHTSRAFDAIAPALPLYRVLDGVPFEAVGVDFVGPLVLRSGKKAWIYIFTCAVYWAAHSELACSLSSGAFIQMFRQFVARRGRPTKIYSDNGTNFRGTENLLSRVRWEEVCAHSATEIIEWIFNPPAAPWWVRFWERMIGMLKRLLRRTFGKASLGYEELMTVLRDCKSVFNNRPITYLSDEPQKLQALTPNMFLRELAQDGVVAT